jgi:hypothetical protein
MQSLKFVMNHYSEYVQSQNPSPYAIFTQEALNFLGDFSVSEYRLQYYFCLNLPGHYSR